MSGDVLDHIQFAAVPAGEDGVDDAAAVAAMLGRRVSVRARHAVVEVPARRAAHSTPEALVYALVTDPESPWRDLPVEYRTGPQLHPTWQPTAGFAQIPHQRRAWFVRVVAEQQHVCLLPMGLPMGADWQVIDTPVWVGLPDPDRWDADVEDGLALALRRKVDEVVAGLEGRRLELEQSERARLARMEARR